MCSPLLFLRSRWKLHVLGDIDQAHVRYLYLTLFLLVTVNVVAAVAAVYKMHEQTTVVSGMEHALTLPPFVLLVPQSADGRALNVSCGPISREYANCRVSTVMFEGEQWTLASISCADISDSNCFLAVDTQLEGSVAKSLSLTAYLIGGVHGESGDDTVRLSLDRPGSTSTIAFKAGGTSQFMSEGVITFLAFQPVDTDAAHAYYGPTAQMSIMAVDSKSQGLMPSIWVWPSVVSTQPPSILLSWETTSRVYSWLQMASVIFSIFNVSLTVFSALFPWRVQARTRRTFLFGTTNPFEPAASDISQPVNMEFRQTLLDDHQ